MDEWRNWSGSVVGHPSERRSPRTPAELSAVIRDAPKVRMVGAGHSFTPLCETHGVLLSMAAYEGAVEIAPDRKTVWAPAGWDLQRLTDALWAEGLSLINQGDINAQSLAGAAATGTHGTGATLGSLATQACGFRLMLADGELVECSADLRPQLYQAQRLSLGLFGVVTEIRIHVLPAYHLEERLDRRPLGEVAERLDDLAASHRHMEFFIFPYSDQVIFKTLHPAEPEGNPRIGNDLDEGVFRIACDVGAAVPPLVATLQQLMMRLSGGAKRQVGPAHQIFPSERAIRFEEMEYELPRGNGLDALKETIAYIRKRRLPIAFPLEFRLTAGDDIWMSPFNKGPAASISLHQYAKMPWRQSFAEIEPIFRAAGGRPHWAKRHSLKPADVQRLYPKTPEFLAVREAVDPDQTFVNAHLAQLFNINPRPRP
jgi:FAD-linked oxidoreductase